MPNFAITLNKMAVGQIQFYNLVIDEIDQYDLFIESLERIYLSEINTIDTIISIISENKQRPRGGRWRKLDDKLFEIKTKHLRLYYAVIDSKCTICLGGMKNNQINDIRSVKSLKSRIKNYINQNGEIEIK